MNNIHRLVWNEITNTWVAVAETARSRGKGSGRAARKAFITALTAAGFGMTSALADLPATTVVPASGKTNAYISANGVPVVNIETANATGLSHNYYTKYNVEANGMVLNNGNNSQVARQSQLAGQVVSNLNLVNEATVILNEVVSTNRSTLAGFTEVLGGKADVIVANPNGITCNGCGFINTDRVTLTTGTSNVAGDGSLTGFTVNRGDVLIEGLGANASTQQIFDIVTRSVKVDGKINVPVANSLSLTTGNNIWNYASRNVTGTVAGSGAAPTYAIDSTVLGGMYAGRIRIIATEAGVGVRMLGEVAASADDFTLSSAGKIEIQSALSAARDVSISSTSATGTEDLFLNGAGAKISASRDLVFSATTGQIKLTEGELFAENNLTLTGATLSDVSTTAKTRFGKVNNTLSTTGAANINGSVWGAGSGALLGTFDSLSIGASGATIYAGTTLGLNTTNNLALATAAVNSVGNMTLAASAGAISIAAGANQGVQTTAGNLSLTAGNGLTNAGTMTSDIGSVTARVNGTITNSGTLHAKTTLDIADKTNGSTENVTNSGTLIADGSLTAKAASFTNQSGGTVQGTTGTTLTATSLTNAGTFIASNTAGQAGTFTLGNLTNSGTLQSIQDLILNVSTTLANSGKLLATHDLSVNAGSSALAMTNTSPGVIQAGNALTMTGANATFNTQSGTVLGNTVGLTLSSINNSGTLQSNAGMTLAIGNGLTNSGTLLAKTSLSSNSGSLTNSGTLQANLGSTISVTGTLSNTGALIASDSASYGGALNVGTLSNTGTGVIQSAQSLAVNVSGSTFTNASAIIAANDLTLTSTGSGLTLTNQSGGYLQAGSVTGDTLTIGGTAVVLNNNAGGFMLGDQLAFTLASLTNAGTMQGGAAISNISASGALNNSGTLTLATSGASNSGISAGSLDNSGTLQSAAGMSLTVTNLENNSGTLFAVKNLTSTSGSLTNSGTLQTNQGSTINTGALTNTGDLIASGTGYDGTLNVSTLSNTGTGVIQSARNLAINLSGGTLTNASTIIANNDLTLTSTGSGLTVTNQSGGYLQAGSNSGDTLTIGGTALVLNNNAGGYLLGDQLAFTLASLTNAGTIQGGAANSTITSSGALANSGTLALSTNSAGSGTITASTLSNTGTGVIQSAQNLAINLSGSTLTNAGDIIANNDLTMTSTGAGLTITNQAGGYLQAGTSTGDTLTVNGNAVVLNNNASGNILGDQLAFTLTSLTNAGTIQGGAAASSIGVSGTVTNSGTLSLANNSSGNGTITADTISNSGTLQSEGAATMNLATILTNSGNLLTAGALTVRGTDSAYTVSDTGRMQSGGLMDVKGQGGGSGVDITVGGSGVMFGNSMGVNAGTVTVNNGGMVTSSGNMTIAANTLNFGGTTSRIVAANSGTGNASITLANAFSNVGAVHSSGNMTFSAPSINNTSTGGFSALNTLTLNATGGDLYNAGALYAGSQLNASSTGTFTNVVGTGTIDSSGSMNLSAATFLNNGTVNATNNITISAATFRNETPGGDTRTWGSNSSVTHTQTGYDSQGYNGHGCCDQYETWYYSDTWYRDQYYAGGTPTNKPQIIGGATLTINNFNSGTNIGGVLSGSTLTLSGNGGSTFTNNDLTLHRESYTDTYIREIKYIAAGPAKYHDYSHYNSTVTYTTSAISNIGAGIYGTTLNLGGFALVQAGSPFSASANSTGASGTSASSLNGGVSGTTSSGSVAGASGASGTSLSGSVSGASSSSGVGGITTASGAPAISFGGLVITLPSNPNGYFVTNKNPNSQYLVETNPLFNVGSNYVGSDYMASRYGYNPDTVMKRLGDSNYEAYLIRQQLVSQVGNNIINGYGNEADQMKRLMDQAVDEGKRAGFVFGQALTTDQIANLKSDVVWMVETTVAGQKVLAPVVYLSASTKNSIETGAVIAGENVNMNLTSITNTGGTISGSKSLNITSKGDITNTSGTIKGGNVAIKSTEGSIKNETLVQGSGDDKRYITTIGKTAGITATGNLDMEAKKDISVKGADVKAGGDASLTAGGNITFDTIVNKTTDTTHSSSNSGFQSSSVTTTTSTEKNIGSTLQSGGNLKLKSGGDTTLKGTNASVGGDLDVNAGGDFKVLSVQDKTTTHSESNTAGLGVGGGLGGTEKVTTDSFTGKNVSSTLTVGGNAKVKAAGEMTLQGSDMSVAGNADIDAKKGINVLDGLDEQRTTTKTETTTFLKVGSSGESGSGSGSSSSSKSGQGYAKAEGKADAHAEASGDADLKFSETTTTVNKAGSNTSVSSNLKVGGNLNAKTDGTFKVQGSNVEAGGDLGVDAKNVEVTAGRNETWNNTTTDRVSTGIYNEGKAEAKAGAEGQAKAGTVGTNASGKAEAGAEASGTTTIGARVEKEESTSYKLTNTGSTLKSGGNLNIKAKEDVTFVGSSAESGGDMSIDAKNITNKAAQDIEINTESKSKQTAGLYIDGKVSAEAKASADAGKINIGGDPANAEVKGEAKADVSAGIRYKNEAESSTDGSVTQVTSSFKSGGSITRKATNTITDQGTQIEAGGDINQSAREIKEIEANNSTFSSKDSSSHDVKIGVGASASASAGANAKGETESDAGAGAGFRAKYEGEIKGEKEGSTTAVTSKYKSGGNINSKSEEKTTLIGTQFESKGDVNLEAGSLEFKAAKDTTTKSGTSHEIGAELKVDVVGKAGGSLEAEYKGSGESEKTSTARTGSVNAGGNLNIKTKSDASFEGTNLESGGDASVKAGGSVDFKAARDTSESSSKSGSVSLELSSSKSSKGGKLEGEYAQEDSSSSKAQTGGIKSGGKLEVSAGKDASFEGTELKSKGDASIEAGGNVSLKAAKDTETSLGFGVEASLSAEKGKEGSKKGGSVGGNVEYSDKAESKGTSIESDGKVTIKGNNVVNQEADINAKGGEKVTGNVINEKTDNHDIAVGIEMSVSGEKETKAKP